MARWLDRIWVRFGLATSVAIVVTLLVLLGCMVLFLRLEYKEFLRSLPEPVRIEIKQLERAGQGEGPRAMEIYDQYWMEEPFRSEKRAFWLAIFVGLPFGLTVAFWVSRRITQPLDSMAEVAHRVASGDMSARADSARAHGEMGEMVGDFNHMIDAMDALDRERRTTMASLSHELRTPLAVLCARLHAICDEVIPASPEEMHTLLDKSLHLSRLVEDMHTFSLATTGRLSLNYQWLDLAALVANEVQGFDARLRAQGFDIELSFPADQVECLVLADPVRMRQVVANLVENVLRHAANGRWIGVSVAAREGRVTFSVGDAGSPLSVLMLKRAFEVVPQREDSGRQSSGLGLLIVQALVTAQGGSVWADSSERGGVCINVSFPASHERPDDTDVADCVSA